MKLNLFFTIFCFGFCCTVGLSQNRLSGLLTDESTGDVLIGATVTAGEYGTISDIDGTYSLDVPDGVYDVTVSYVGYDTQVIRMDISKNQKFDLKMSSGTILQEVVVTADIAIERETPVAFSNIPTIKIQEELAAQDIPMLLNSTPGAYATETGGGDGDARITIRGFNQRNIAVMLDGIPVNDMENGRVFWSNWFGLDLVTQTMQVQRGLGASKLSVPSVGGTINILTKGIDAKRGLSIKQELGNNGFLRTTLGATTGRMENGWGVSMAASYKQGDGWVDGNFTKGYFYYLRINKQLGQHLVSLQGFGAPQKHGQRPFSAEIGQVDSQYASELGVPGEVNEELNIRDQGRRYNSHWGYLNGEVYNTRINYYHKPQISLRHSWQASEKVFWSNVAYLSIGSGGGTAREGVSIPLDENNQPDINKAIEANQPTAFNPEGQSNTFIRAGVNNHFWYGLLSTLKYDLNEDFSISGGLDARSYEGDHHREIYDLLGGTSWGPNKIGVGDKFEYDYTGLVDQIGTFALIEYKKEKWASFLNLSVANSKYSYVDNFSGFELDAESLLSSTIKLGATYKFNPSSSVFFNTGYLSKAQRYSNVIIPNWWTSEADAQIANSFDNEKIQAVELGYNFKSPKFAANINTYYTQWQNKPLERLPTISEDPSDPESDRIPVNIPGIDALHAGIEIDFAYAATDKISIEGLASIGDWTWQSGETVQGVLPNGVSYSYEFDATGVHVGDAAQIQFGGLIRYEPIDKLYVKFKSTYFDKNYANFQPENLQGADGGRESWLMPSYFISSLHTGYTLKLNEKRINLRFNILNLFDTVYLSDARDNDDFNSPSFRDFDAKSASVFYGQGRRWSFSVQANF